MVTILYYYEDMSIKTIASIVNIAEGTVNQDSPGHGKNYIILLQERKGMIMDEKQMDSFLKQKAKLKQIELPKAINHKINLT